MKTIAALLTVFNRKETTLRCLDNLFKQFIPQDYSLEVYLTNDGCTDGTPEAVRVQFPLVNIIDGDGSLFWNRGMWTAWDVAAKTKEYDFYLWLNDDTFLYDGAVEKLLTTSQKFKDQAIVVGACHDTTTHSKITYGGRNRNGIVLPDGNDAEIKHFNGNIVLVPRYVYEKLGNLDYYYSHSKGDFDYGIRAQKIGIKMIQCGIVLGACDVHPRIDKWCDPEIPLKKRWKYMNKPNGMPPKETFHLEKQTNIVLAAVHFVTVYIRCLFPILWNHKIKG
ncbi:glycosyltransferase family 2 protein [Fibrobacter sp. UBA4297]|uniref:glycosyltransferase family 2 protein n=1 Tax=Fibrobacter sp. UBA4297 TaxID=1946536 RepID=UPI0025C2F3FA|nr:glycosyltransferase family 2 protein [Fibrobacter sp. UBA4297]